MHLSLVFYVFLSRMAVGTLLSLLPLWGMRAAERHLRFQLLFALCLLIGSAALYGAAAAEAGPGWPQGTEAFLSLGGAAPGALVLTGLLCLAANALYGTFRRGAARTVLALACAAGIWAVVGTARLGPVGAQAGAGALAVLSLSGLLGGFVMGSINNAMVLGHFYLLIRGLPLDALRRAGQTVAVALLAKIAVLGGVLLFWQGAADLLLGREIIWLTWRTMFGFAGPLVLLWMVKDTVRLKHTQAATGLLYVAVGFALMGELAAVYIETATGLPV